MLSALIGIGGVILGVALTSLLTLLVNRRARMNRARAGARLLLPELAQNEHSLDTAISSERCSDLEFDSEVWRRHQHELMGCMDRGWTDLATVYAAFALMAKDRAGYEFSGQAQFDPDLIDWMLIAQERARRALVHLEEIAELPESEAILIPENFGV